MEITNDERRRRLAHRHLLIPAARVDTVDEVADTLVALHSSDPVTVYLSAALRLCEPSIVAVDRALYDDRSLLRHHAMRRTIWVMPTNIARHAHDGFTRKIAAAERRRTAKLFDLDESAVADAIERVTAVIDEAGGPMSTRQVGEAEPELAVPVPINQGTNYSGTMAMHVRSLLVAAFEGRIARGRPAGSWIASQYDWWPHSMWTGTTWTPGDEADGAAEVVRRWLATSGPATLDDLVWWTGATKTLIRTVLERIGATEVDLVDDPELGPGYVLTDDDASDTVDPGPWVALLPGLDPTAMGWKRRSWYLDAETNRRVTDRNGNIGPTVWADGRVAGGWAQRRDGTIAHDVDLAALDPVHADLLEAEIDRLRDLVGDTRFTARFPSPNQQQLLA